MFQAKMMKALDAERTPPLPYEGAMEALDTMTRLYRDLTVAFNDTMSMNGQFPSSTEEVDAELQATALEARGLFNVVDARLKSLHAMRKTVRKLQRERYLAEAPFKIGDPVCYVPEGKREFGEPMSAPIRGTLTDYIVDPHNVRAVVDGVLVYAHHLQAVDAMTRLGELVQAEQDALREAGHSYTPPSLAKDAPIYFLKERYGDRQNVANTPLDPYDRGFPDDRGFDSGELDRHDQNHDQDQPPEPRDIKEHHGPITAEPSDAVVIQSDPVDVQSDEDDV